MVMLQKKLMGKGGVHPWREQLEFVHLLVLVVVRADHKAQLVYANAF